MFLVHVYWNVDVSAPQSDAVKTGQVSTAAKTKDWQEVRLLEALSFLIFVFFYPSGFTVKESALNVIGFAIAYAVTSIPAILEDVTTSKLDWIGFIFAASPALITISFLFFLWSVLLRWQTSLLKYSGKHQSMVAFIRAFIIPVFFAAAVGGGIGLIIKLWKTSLLSNT